jgi:hypothetical protein
MKESLYILCVGVWQTGGNFNTGGKKLFRAQAVPVPYYNSKLGFINIDSKLRHTFNIFRGVCQYTYILEKNTVFPKKRVSIDDRR